MLRLVFAAAALLLTSACVTASRTGPVVEPVWNETPVTPRAVFAAYAENPIAAADLLEFKRVRVHGVVSSVADAGEHQAMVLIVDPDDEQAVLRSHLGCTGLPRRVAGSLRPGFRVTVTGFFDSAIGGAFFSGCELEDVGQGPVPAVSRLADVKAAPGYRAPILVDAQELDRAFARDPEAAQEKYGDAPLVVRGLVRFGSSKSRFSNPLRLHTGDLRAVWCDIPEYGFRDLEPVTLRAWFRSSGLTGVSLQRCTPVHGDKTDAAPARAL